MALHKIVLSPFQVLVCVGKEQIWQDGMVRLSHSMDSQLLPQFVNDGYVKAEITYSTVHVCHEVLTSSWVAVGYMYIWTFHLKNGSITAVSQLYPLS